MSSRIYVISLCLASSIAFGQKGTWPDGFLKAKLTPKVTKPAKNPSRSTNKVAVSSKPKPLAPKESRSPKTKIVGFDPFNPTPEQRQRMDATDRELNLLLIEGKGALESGQTGQVVPRIEIWTEANPRSTILSSLLFDLYLVEGRTSLATESIRPKCVPSASDKVLLRGSFASATSGQVFSGQYEFVLRSIDPLGLKSEYLSGSVLPLGNQPQKVAMLSALAIALEAVNENDLSTAKWYLNWSKQREPSNPLLAQLLGGYWKVRRNYTASAAAYAAGIPRATGRLKRNLEFGRDEMQRRADGG